MATRAINIVNQVLDELRDANGTRYSRSSILFKLREALNMFMHDTCLLKRRLKYTAIPGKVSYMLPDGTYNHPDDYDFAAAGTGKANDTIVLAAAGTDFLLGKVVKVGNKYYKYLGEKRVFSSSSSVTMTLKDAPSAATDVQSIILASNELNSDYWSEYVTPQYIKAVRFSWGKDDDNTMVLTPDSLYNRDTVGFPTNQAGRPTYVYTDLNNFYQFSLWPVPDAYAVANDGFIFLDYVRAADYVVDENSVIDPDLPRELVEHIYTLVCFLRLKASNDQADVAKAPMYLEIYKNDVLRRANELMSHMDRYNKLVVQA